MSERFKTEQEAFWAGDFGDAYTREPSSLPKAESLAPRAAGAYAS